MIRTEEEVKAILERYKLPKEEHDEYFDVIKRVWSAGKYPVKHPTAVIIGGQTGAGKSSIISYSQKMFRDSNVVVINSDELKPFHPKEEEIASKFPDLYTIITDQESNSWTSELFKQLREEKYNLIFEGTMKNNRIADDAIVALHELGYTVVVRGLAVCDLESRLSILERYVGQLESKGYGRLVVPTHHNQTYVGMPQTIDYIERNGRYDCLEIFTRGSAIGSPNLAYSHINPSTVELTKEALSDKSFVSKSSQNFGYDCAKEAIDCEREKGYAGVVRTFENRAMEIFDAHVPEVSGQMDELTQMYKEVCCELDNERNCPCCSQDDPNQ